MDTSRRQILAAAGASALALLPTQAMSQACRKRSFRVAYFTDTHIPAGGSAASWLATALQHAQTRRNKPDFVFFGGDMIMDALGQPQDSVKAQWAQFQSVVKTNTQVPVQYCLGNHDIWGWEKQSGATNTHALYGKNWAMDLLEWQRPYRSFDVRDWHFVVLDSMSRARNGYIGRLDDPQFEWLEDDLKANRKKKTVIVSHIPIISVCPMFFDQYERDGKNWQVPGWLTHIDARRFKNLFAGNPQVKTCLSGHIHMLDKVSFNGVTYLCNGSVAGSWWKGPFQETEPGYAMIDFYNDGTVHREYVDYGWKNS